MFSTPHFSCNMMKFGTSLFYLIRIESDFAHGIHTIFVTCLLVTWSHIIQIDKMFHKKIIWMQINLRKVHGFVYMCACLCICKCTLCVQVNLHVCVEAYRSQKTALWCHHQAESASSLKQGFSLASSTPFRIDLLASEAQIFSTAPLGCVTTSGIYTSVWEIKLRFSCFWGKYFNNLALSMVLSQSYFCLAMALWYKRNHAEEQNMPRKSCKSF